MPLRGYVTAAAKMHKRAGYSASNDRRRARRALRRTTAYQNVPFTIPPATNTSDRKDFAALGKISCFKWSTGSSVSFFLQGTKDKTTSLNEILAKQQKTWASIHARDEPNGSLEAGSLLSHNDAIFWMSCCENRLPGVKSLGWRRDDPQRRARSKLDCVIDRVTKVDRAANDT